MGWHEREVEEWRGVWCVVCLVGRFLWRIRADTTVEGRWRGGLMNSGSGLFGVWRYTRSWCGFLDASNGLEKVDTAR